MTNIASSESAFVLRLVENNLIKILLQVINSTSHFEVKEQAIWCLGNISGDNHKYRDAILELKAAESIANLIMISPPGISFVRNASWTLGNFCKGKPPARFELLLPGIPAMIKVMIENDSEEILQDMTWAFSYVTDEGGDDRIRPFIEC